MAGNFQGSDLSSEMRKHLTDHLQAIVGDRSPFTSPEHLSAVGNYIAAQFTGFGMEPERELVVLDGLGSFNVIVELPGRDPAAPPDPGRGAL